MESMRRQQSMSLTNFVNLKRREKQRKKIMDNILVRVMTSDDIDQVVEIEEEAFSSPWTRKGFEE